MSEVQENKVAKKAKTIEKEIEATEERVTPALQSCLINKKVRLKFVPKNVSKITNNLSEATAFTYTNHSIILPKSRITNRFVDPLTSDERLYLESRLGVNLDVAKEKDNYWSKIRVELKKQDPVLDRNYVELDLNDPHQYLRYKMLLVAPEVANSAVTDFSVEHKFFIEDRQLDDVQRYGIEEQYDRAMEFKLRLKGNRKGLYDFMRVLSESVKTLSISANDTEEYLYSRLGTLIRENKTLTKVNALVEKIEKDETGYHLSLLILDGIRIGEIVSTHKGYELTNGVFIGSDMSEAIIYLKDPRNAAARSRIMQQVDIQLNKK